ncbi:hypothetical protein PGTUg99_009021 [Puccinia graminis f. sp. tritici]|uniref:Uncharacterized protein n=1 Tax=Puccinia graminis f. sp. tritici TaxID=56615 RepID=A0A5B0RVP8_PUCGR|nr:hypothetical protein PGTUg99_009021 [Puccinia graminis f. sp. tritici]
MTWEQCALAPGSTRDRKVPGKLTYMVDHKYAIMATVPQRRYDTDTFRSSGASTQRQTKIMGRVDQAVELALICPSHRSCPDPKVGPPDAFRSGCRHGRNGQPTTFHTGG